MQILLVTATKLEVAPLAGFIKEHKEVDLLVTGVGGIATTYALTKAIARKPYQLLLQAGIAGSFSDTFAPGSRVVVGSDCFADLGVQEQQQFRSVFDLGLVPPNEKPFKEGWLANPHHELLKKTGLPVVKGVTVNEISTARFMMNYLHTQLEGVVESMEGAGFHYVALNEKVPFLQIRTISNYAGERDKKKWKLKESIAALNEITEQLLTSFLQ